MIKYLILFGVGYLLYRSMKTWMFPDNRPNKNVSDKTARQVDDVMIKDPLCGTYFPRRNAVHLNLNGNDLYFCSEACRDRYLARRPKET